MTRSSVPSAARPTDPGDGALGPVGKGDADRRLGHAVALADGRSGHAASDGALEVCAQRRPAAGHELDRGEVVPVDERMAGQRGHHGRRDDEDGGAVLLDLGEEALQLEAGVGDHRRAVGERQ
jgi:hypothetical protein